MKEEKIMRMSDIDFINKGGAISWAIVIRPADYNNSGLAEIALTIKRGEVERRYHPNDYLNYVIESHSAKMSETRDLHKQYDLALGAKTATIYQIETYNEMIHGTEGPIETYNFAPSLNKATAMVEYIKGKIDNQGYRREKYKFWWGVFTGATTATISLLIIYLKMK